MGVESTSFHDFANDESLWNVFDAYYAYFNAEPRQFLKALGQFENLVFLIMSTREDTRLIARTPSAGV